MGVRQTSVAERHRFIDQKLKGCSLKEIAAHSGRSLYCVRHWWRRYRDGGRQALDPPDRRKQRGGHMSTCRGAVRLAFLRVKKDHPKWGAAVARSQVAERLEVAEESLPSVSTIEKYWAQYRGRLYKRHRQRAPGQAPGPRPREPHERWQADFKVKMSVEGVGQTDVFNIRDDASPVKIGSFVYPTNGWDDRQIQQALRCAFTRWGLCDRLQTDRESRLVNISSDEPFPSRFTLWLVGLGISHELARSAQHNGCAERFNRTWYDRVVAGQTFRDYDDLQRTSDQALEWLNHRLPSRGRACHNRPPLEAYPQALTPRRPYAPEKERDLFSMTHVYLFLAGQHWWRKVSQVGQFTIAGQRYGIGMAQANQDVRITFDPDTVEFVVENAQGVEVKRLTPKGLTIEEITGLDPDPPAA